MIHSLLTHVRKVSDTLGLLGASGFNCAPLVLVKIKRERAQRTSTAAVGGCMTLSDCCVSFEM